MTNLPFNTNPNIPNLQQPMVGQPPYGGYNQQYNPPPPTITFSIIEGFVSVKTKEEWGGLNRPSFFLRKEDCYGV